jgi:lysophospholipid acyltransferase (LPLAT)-like uncharacterized protein
VSSKKRRRLLSRDFEQTLAVRLGAPAVFWALRALKATWRVRRLNGERALAKPCIIAIYHCDLLMAAMDLPRILPNADVLISQSRDGEVISRFVEKFKGANVIRGGSSRGAEKAFMQMVRSLEAGHALVIPVDGPRGPRGVVKPGIIAAAAQTGAPIMPGACIVDRKWVFRSWDRMVLPKPGSKVELVHGPHYLVPKGIDRTEQEAHRQNLERIMRDLRGESEPSLPTNPSIGNQG